MSYFIGNFAKKKEQDPIVTPKETAIASLIGGGVVASGVPGYAVNNLSWNVFKKTRGRKLTDDELKKLSKKYNIDIEVNPKYGYAAYAIPTQRKIILGDKSRTTNIFQHELGHINDKGFKDVVYPNGSFRSTFKSLRDEGVANINAIKHRGLKQVPNAIGSYGTYIGKALSDHKKSLGGIVAGTGLTIAGINHLKNRKKS